MPKAQLLHQVAEQSIQAGGINELIKPDTIIWAKLRGYPWWPGKIKSFDQAPKELEDIARTQYRAGSLVPSDSLRPFQSNWQLFSTRSTGIKFRNALAEAQNPELYKRFEIASQRFGYLADAPLNPETAVKRKRGRPPKNSCLEEPNLPLESPKKILRMKERPPHLGLDGMATREHILYCRIKLQKILLRTQLKECEIPVAGEIINVLLEDKVTIESIRNTNVGRVLRIASLRQEFCDNGPYKETGNRIQAILDSWRKAANIYITEMGL